MRVPTHSPYPFSMDQRLTNKQILGRLQAEFRGCRVESILRDRKFRVSAPGGREYVGEFEQVRNPATLQKALTEIRRGLS